MTELSVVGMTCGNCARHVTEAIQDSPGVAGASVRLETGRATVKWKSGPNIPTVLKAIQAAGYEASPLPGSATANADIQKETPSARWQMNLVMGLAATVPLIIGEWVFGWGMRLWFQWSAFALALPVQIFCGTRFYAGAWRQLKVGGSNMDTLVALGSTTAFAYSAWALFTGAPGHLYFMEAAAIITLISLGHWFEARVSARAESSLRALMELAPATARRRDRDGSETDTPVRDLRENDVIILKPGDHIPVDGVVMDGTAAADESMLTGESLPVNKTAGDKLYAGTVNLDGLLVARVTGTGDTTALAQIIAAVEHAQNSRAQIQRLGDRISAVFVPVVITVAVATGLWWGLDFSGATHFSGWLGGFLWHTHLPETALAAAFIHATAVLIISCPCAMGLATPVAIMAGANAAARRGILIRDGVALEQAGQITSIIFDKTGTLTLGKPEVADSQTFAASHAPNAITLAAALARRSNHPISHAIAKLAADEFPFIDWREERGAGLEAVLPSGGPQPTPAKFRLGSLRWLRANAVDLAAGAAFESAWSGKGASVLGIAADRQLLALFAVTDTLKPGVAEVVKQLTASGLAVFLVTGDNSATAQTIASQAGIDPANVLAEARPAQKAEFIRGLQARGARVAFVGDGINDAPALEAADLGVAVNRASDVARAAADMVLLNSEIQAVPEALALARATLRTIKQNLFWAFFYNAAAIPLAATGFLSPVVCALAMGVSDLVVIGNALRLLRRNPAEIRAR